MVLYKSRISQNSGIVSPHFLIFSLLSVKGKGGKIKREPPTRKSCQGGICPKVSEQPLLPGVSTNCYENEWDGLINGLFNGVSFFEIYHDFSIFVSKITNSRY